MSGKTSAVGYSGELAPNWLSPADPRWDLGHDHTLRFFSSQFDLAFDSAGSLTTEPSQEQLRALHTWHQSTAQDGIIMPDLDSLTKKAILAAALMPQKDEQTAIQYLFGKGTGVELALQGQVVGRAKKQTAVPYRTHSDFEIYGVTGGSYDRIPNSARFRSVFGGQEIFPETRTKTLSELPTGLLKQTAETVQFAGREFLVPGLEFQFVEKMINLTKRVEEEQRGATDAALLAATYDLDMELVHSIIDEYVIMPAQKKLPDIETVADRTLRFLERKLNETRERIAESYPTIGTEELANAVRGDFHLSEPFAKRGVSPEAMIVGSPAGITLADDAREQVEAGIRSLHTRRHAELNSHHTNAMTLLHSPPPMARQVRR